MEDKNSELNTSEASCMIKKFSRLMWNNSMSLFGSLAGDCSILQRRLQKQNSTQQPFREEICRCSRLRERIFCAKI